MNFWSALRNTAAITVASVANMLIGSMTDISLHGKKWKINKVIFGSIFSINGRSIPGVYDSIG